MPRDGDLNYNQLAERAIPTILRGGSVYVKWTCPDCNERVLSDKPLELHPTTGQVIFPVGYLHTERGDGSACDRYVSTTEYVFGMVTLERIPAL